MYTNSFAQRSLQNPGIKLKKRHSLGWVSSANGSADEAPWPSHMPGSSENINDFGAWLTTVTTIKPQPSTTNSYITLIVCHYWPSVTIMTRYYSLLWSIRKNIEKKTVIQKTLQCFPVDDHRPWWLLFATSLPKNHHRRPPVDPSVQPQHLASSSSLCFLNSEAWNGATTTGGNQKNGLTRNGGWSSEKTWCHPAKQDMSLPITNSWVILSKLPIVSSINPYDDRKYQKQP